MIRIVRSTCPPCLSKKKAKQSYSKREVVAALWAMQNRKCCYSEVQIPSEGHGKAVEHFRPKSKFKWLRNQWKNLLLVCPQCNGKKSDQFPEMLTTRESETKVVYTRKPKAAVSPLIDPSDASTDPEEHLTYVLDDADPLFGQIIPRNQNPTGQTTIAITGIDDEFFFRARKRRALEVLTLEYRNLLIAAEAGNDEALAAGRARFALLLSASAEFAGLARQYARYKKLDQRFGVQIPGPALT